MASPKPLVAFYGATGGCTLAALTLALEAGYDCTALARTPSKLTSLLLSRDVPESTLSTQLTITPGSSLDPTAVAGPLTHNGRPADIIISGIGHPPVILPEVTLCEKSIANIIAAVKQAQMPKKPLLVAISSTGLTHVLGGVRDVPLLMLPLYRLLGHQLHADKARMERLIEMEVEEEGARAVVVRPSALTNGVRLGSDGVRVGRREAPAVGYTISREDVGGWLFEEVIQRDGGKWVGEKVSLSY